MGVACIWILQFDLDGRGNSRIKFRHTINKQYGNTIVNIRQICNISRDGRMDGWMEGRMGGW